MKKKIDLLNFHLFSCSGEINSPQKKQPTLSNGQVLFSILSKEYFKT